ncbi:DUF3386 domain-containing protein [Fischerella sp. NIES-3754]|uniref:DUF3386 domain-containing protein n=1 Tax=Fischerella sp. NIES-3754 TaxID=1752063 RepID=UPI00072172B4|nr:DUF3386 domain-containing protein [Fischerella sp. NIES-3754]BAU07125.1 hypothetical protein FIS3754_30510 [Fischerella sp. NIES-3754]BCX09446.1 MAG: hypothetical protein KatS3mg066_3305 [Fischerella sp.]
MTTPDTARKLFQTAYESRYTWDKNFPGYSADVQVVQGAEVYTGQVRINHDMSIEVTRVSDQQVAEGIYTQLQDMVTHRQRIAFEESHGNHEFVLGERDNTDAVEILVKGNSIDSNYKIRDKQVCQVNRTMGRMAFVIDTYQSLDTGEGYIPISYQATFRNTQTNKVTSILKFEDTYEKIGNYYIMTKQVVQEYIDDKNTTNTDFNYSNIVLN